MNKQEIEKAIYALENAKLYIFENSNRQDYSLEALDRLSIAVDDAVSSLEHQLTNGWIPVSERLPNKEEYLKDDGRFIVTDGNRRYQGWFDIYEGHFAKEAKHTLLTEDTCVIAWQPLPEPWKEELSNSP